MHLVTTEDYLRFLENGVRVRVGGCEIELRGHCEDLPHGGIPDCPSEQSTVWSFPNRGGWATHKGDYPGNWSPYVPRNLIERFTTKGDLVLDSMMGSGTTLVECKLLGRRAVGVDINREAVMLAHDRLNFTTEIPPVGPIRLYMGDARNLDELDDNSIDLVATHPPYADMVRYGGGRVDGDLSNLTSVADYLSEMALVAGECFRVLKDGRHCAILMGDTRVHAHYVPLSFMVMVRFLETGFVLKEDIIKVQHNVASERERWNGPARGFYKIAHEHLFVFRKPKEASELVKLRLSRMVV